MSHVDRTDDQVAADIDRITGVVGALVSEEEHLAASMALTLLAAEHVLHDDGTKEDFLRVAEASWRKARSNCMRAGHVGRH